MLTGIHFLLTYMCNLECDHCFIYSGPNAKGTFTLSQIRKALDEAIKIRTIKWIYFEGGEPFLFYPLMLEGIKIARNMGFKVGVVTNAYYAISEEDAGLWLRPLCKLGISNLSISDDLFHYEEEEDNPAKRTLSAAKRLGMPVGSICIEKPAVEIGIDKEQDKGAPVIGGGAMFRGRAVEKLVEDLPQRWWEEFIECPYEDLKKPERVHLDSYGNIHLCQGLSMGNMWKNPLSILVRNYDADSHPICGPLVRGGPALLAKEYDVKHEDKYVDACHFCYLIRWSLIDRFPQYLAPRQVYGLE
ncbi:4Fe-4S cluster-binding domain-containing protein [candidate division WOR-3 bacterium]|nr:4Fe-4S cluster-binding domain-containing protein [candidate division WOR-3 bacterium]